MNTSELEARLAGLLEKAPEEWSIVEYGDGDSLAIHSDDENRVCFMATHGGSRTAWERIQAHADLIAEGKNALPALLQSLSTLRQCIEALEAENGRLRNVLDTDRYKVAIGVASVAKAVQGRQWLSEPGRGSYAWDDERYQQEFGAAITEIYAALKPLQSIAQDWSDCPRDPIEVEKNRNAARQALGEG